MTKMLIYPMAFYAFFMWFIALYMFYTRVRAIKTGEVSIKYFRAFVGESPAERTVLVGRHYDNQFQVPILFLITCVVHLFLGRVDVITLTLAWIFVVSRILHSWVHLGSNRIQNRAAAFMVGWLTIAFLWMQIVYFLFQ